jgi:4-hydroxy-tetrahydrodipicolinate synthase
MKTNAKSVFKGIWSAIPSFFASDFKLDLESLGIFLATQKQLQGVVVCGTTGEASTLSFEEKVQIIKSVKGIISNSLMVGVGTSDTRQSCELALMAEDLGADSLLVVTPPYNKPNLSGLMAHYEALAKVTKLPMCLYHVPSRTGQFLKLNDLKELLTIPAIQAVKEASGDLSFFAQACDASPRVAFLSGDDATFTASLAVGATGCISVASNVVPDLLLDICSSYGAGKNAELIELNTKLMQWARVLFLECNPVPLKVVLKHKLGTSESVRLPLGPLSELGLNEISRFCSSQHMRYKQ